MLKFGLPGGRSLDKTIVSDRCFNLTLKMTFAQDVYLTLMVTSAQGVYFTLRMTCTQDFETPVTTNSPSQDSFDPDNQIPSRYERMKDKADSFSGSSVLNSEGKMVNACFVIFSRW